MDVEDSPATGGSRVGGTRGRVLVGVDRSPGSREALRFALAEAERTDDDLQVVATYALPLPWAGGTHAVVPDPQALYRETLARTRAFVDDVRAAAGDPPVRIDVEVLEGPAADVLVGRSADADLLVVGSRGRGMVRTALLGSVAMHCLGGAACPVVVVPPRDAGGTPRPRVVVGIDGSPESRVALATAATAARRLGGDVEAVAACERDDWNDLATAVAPTFAGLRDEVARGAARMVETVLGAGAQRVPVHVDIVDGAPSDVLVERAQGASLLVLGHRGSGRGRGMLLGSVALRCAMTTPCPVLVVRARPEGTSAAGQEVAAVLAGR